MLATPVAGLSSLSSFSVDLPKLRLHLARDIPQIGLVRGCHILHTGLVCCCHILQIGLKLFEDRTDHFQYPRGDPFRLIFICCCGQRPADDESMTGA